MIRGRLMMIETAKRGISRLVQYGNGCFVKCASDVSILYEETEGNGVTSIILVVIRPNTKVIINPMSIRCPSLRA